MNTEPRQPSDTRRMPRVSGTWKTRETGAWTQSTFRTWSREERSSMWIVRALRWTGTRSRLLAPVSSSPLLAVRLRSSPAEGKRIGLW